MKHSTEICFDGDFAEIGILALLDRAARGPESEHRSESGIFGPGTSSEGHLSGCRVCALGFETRSRPNRRPLAKSHFNILHPQLCHAGCGKIFLHIPRKQIYIEFGSDECGMRIAVKLAAHESFQAMHDGAAVSSVGHGISCYLILSMCFTHSMFHTINPQGRNAFSFIGTEQNPVSHDLFFPCILV
jgi:hypothetical protein